ncbi:MAG: hypothetical protein ACQETL_03725 [Bacteroidota bacterium]
MEKKIVYQTLEDRDTDLDKLELNGPYKCNWDNSWLGEGYYFWDSFIENAHWWGETRRYSNGYIICKAECNFNDNKCFDLVGNTNHLMQIRETFQLMEKEGLANKHTTVKRIIEFLQRTKNFPFSATRVYGLKSKNFHSKFGLNLIFEENRKAVFDVIPTIQICFYKKGSLNLRNYKIIYPDDYRNDYLV